MQVSHVEKNMVKQSSTIPNVNLNGGLKPYLGLDLMDPWSSFILPLIFKMKVSTFSIK